MLFPPPKYANCYMIKEKKFPSQTKNSFTLANGIRDQFDTQNSSEVNAQWIFFFKNQFDFQRDKLELDDFSKIKHVL